MSEITKKKICFSLLVHENKKLVEQLVLNIKHYCPNSIIVVYNGGYDQNLCNDLNVPVCPTSRKLKYGNISQYFLETMEWIEELGIEYDYFINLDSDVLFFRSGYEIFIEEQMQDADYMAVKLRIPEENWTCGKSFKKDIQRWKPFFPTKPFWGVFNVGQVFSRILVKTLINYEKKELLKTALQETNVFGIEEIVFVNLANKLGFKMKNYPKQHGAKVIRYRPYFNERELINCLRKNRGWLVHPINRNINDQARNFIYNIQNKKIKEIDQNSRKKSQTFNFHNINRSRRRY